MNMEEKVKESLSLFEVVKKHVLENLNDGNSSILSSISKIENSDTEYDYHSMGNALGVIHKHFSNNESVIHRRYVYQTYASRILVENLDQLVSNYNRILDSVRKFFPDFNLVHEGHNRIFGVRADYTCNLRKCSDDEIVSRMKSHGLQEEDIDEEDIEYEKKLMTEFYESEFSDTVNGKARNVSESGLSVFTSNLKSVLERYGYYTGNGYIPINALFRGDRNANTTMSNMITAFRNFAQVMILPLYIEEDIVLYRGDGLSVSSDRLVTKGFYSGGLSILDMGGFVKNGGRLLKITVPGGTPFLPLILDRHDEGEIVLLPGTTLEKTSQMDLENGHYSEYTVVGHPPKFTELEEATILKNFIPHTFEEIISTFKVGGNASTKRKKKAFLDTIPPPQGTSSEEETTKFIIDLVNSKYGGDW